MASKNDHQNGLVLGERLGIGPYGGVYKCQLKDKTKAAAKRMHQNINKNYAEADLAPLQREMIRLYF